MADVALRKVVKRYDDVEAVRGIDLDIADHEFIVLVGPSGCGKSTTLRMIAGLEDITGGDIFIGGDVAVARRQVVDQPVADPDIAAGDVLQPRDHAQRGGLAAAGRADQGHELLVGDLEIDVLHGVEQRAIMLVELAE